MADDDDYFGGEPGDEGEGKPKDSGGGGLRRQLEQTLAELKKEREAREKLEAKDKQHAIDKAFADLEVPEKVRKFYSGDPDKDKILEWCKENSEVFGLSLGGEESDETKQQNEQLKKVAQAGQVGFDASDRAPESIVQKALAGIQSGKMTEAELNAEINKLFGR